jgi:heme-degrading monooxygenase HmoA
MIKRLVKLTFQLDKTDEFLTIFEDSKHLIRQRAGCQHLELLRDVTTPHIFFTLSFWDYEADLNAYRNSELFKTTWAKTKILFSDKPQAWTTTLVSIAIE